MKSDPCCHKRRPALPPPRPGARCASRWVNVSARFMCALLVTFFFKQKTAYEMYDWSSDVCSSDLRARADLEDLVVPFEMERFGHEGNDIGLGERLFVPDGDGKVAVGVHQVGLADE